jgi:hypothetical protein
MGFAQLYYTSCEIGLSGFAGFQFNAVTPGLAPEVLRTVESLTSYQAPRGLSARPTAAEIAGCPVNLIYTCGPGAIVANVIFTGTDFSQRSGNYFAHAIVSQDGVSAFGEILPIELWKSPDWASEPVADTELPMLSSPPRLSRDGELSREEIGRFLDRGVQGEQLTALLTAAENAVLRSGRPIIIVDPDTAVVARWIAAVCFLLHPAVARRLSFATYHHNPGHVDVHVIGTLPDSDFDLNETAFRSYVVFDVRTARTSDVAPEPGTALLVRAGPRRAAALWQRAGGLADIAGETLADWHPALVMAALLDGPEVALADLDVLSDWLPRHAASIPPGECREILRAFLDNAARRPRHLAALAVLARRAADPGLAQRIEHLAVQEELRRAVAGEDISTGVPVTTAEGRAFAAAECAERLPEASAQVAISLLGWSTDLGLALPDAALRTCGERVLGPQLLRGPDENTLGVVAGARSLLEGVLACLAAAVDEQPRAVDRAFEAGLDTMTAERPGMLPDALQETALVAHVRKHPDDRIRALSRFMAKGRTEAGQPSAESHGRGRRLSEDLMRRMWPEGRWTAPEAVTAVGTFEPEQLLAEPVHGWIVRAVTTPLREPGYLEPYEEFCRDLETLNLDRTLPDKAREQLGSFLATLGKIEKIQHKRGKFQAVFIQQLAASYAGLAPPAQDRLRAALAGQVERLAGSRYLPVAVETFPVPVVSAFLDAARRRLRARPADVGAAARLLRALASLMAGRDKVIAPGLDEMLREELRVWRRADLNHVYDRLQDEAPEVAQWFSDWRQKRLATRLRRSWRRLVTGHAEGGP